jgi:anthranilate/para-aminobenzoate synthase component II
MILIIRICNEDMHYHEFVRPIEEIIKNVEEPYVTKYYMDVKKKDLESSHRIIITGTSLADVSYIKDISKFRFLKSYKKPVLAICGGMQLLCMIYGCRLSKYLEIGLKEIKFNAEFLGMKDSREVYELHNMFVKDDDLLKKTFHIYSKSSLDSLNDGLIQAVKHKHLKHYGTLFHPEVRNRDMIVNFLYV